MPGAGGSCWFIGFISIGEPPGRINLREWGLGRRKTQKIARRQKFHRWPRRRSRGGRGRRSRRRSRGVAVGEGGGEGVGGAVGEGEGTEEEWGSGWERIKR